MIISHTSGWNSGFENQKQILLGPSKPEATTVYATPLESSLVDIIRQRLHSDDFAQDVLPHIRPGHASCLTLQGLSQHYQEFKCHDVLLFYNNLLVKVPCES